MDDRENDDVFDDASETGTKVTNGGTAEDLHILEALLFASDELMTAARLKTILPGQPDARTIRSMVAKINMLLQKERHPFEIVELGGGYQFRTIAFYHPWVRQIFKEKASKKLSIQALECLAIIAYKQPVSKAEIEAIRGVVSDGAMKTLLEKRLVTISGRSEKPGRPLLYATTNVFLTYFGLNKIGDLPRIEEFEALAREKMDELSADIPYDPEVDSEEGAITAYSDKDLDATSLFEVPASERETNSSIGSDADTSAEVSASLQENGSLPDRSERAADEDTPVKLAEPATAPSVTSEPGIEGKNGQESDSDESIPVFEIQTTGEDISRFSDDDVELLGGALMETKAMNAELFGKKKRKKKTEEQREDGAS